MQSLLGLFYNKIKGSQEDIASESLVYILKQSYESRQVLNQIIRNNTGLDFSDLNYDTQNVGDELERPDISGIDENGTEVFLIEAKFWASLTRNQPNGYLERLGKNTVLMFLVPSLRTRTVFEEIKSRIKEKYEKVEIDNENLKIILTETNKQVFIKSWDEILRAIKTKIEQTNNQNLLSDLNQIIGLCNSIDSNSFQPITDEDLSPSIPKRINSYYELVDKVVDELKNKNNNISTKGLVKTPQRYGYHRYFSTKELGLNFALKLDLWEKCADTPFWLAINEVNKKNEWTTSERLIKSIKTICVKNNYPLIPYANRKGYFIGLKPKTYETEDVVIKHFTNEIEKIINDITNANKM